MVIEAKGAQIKENLSELPLGTTNNYKKEAEAG
jgi:hypothetical protein